MLVSVLESVVVVLKEVVGYMGARCTTSKVDHELPNVVVTVTEHTNTHTLNHIYAVKAKMSLCAV